MEHALNNPIWHALQTGNKNISRGNEQVLFTDRTIGLFAGMEDYSESNFEFLRAQSSSGDFFILFTPIKITIPQGWEILTEKGLHQMVYPQANTPVQEESAIVALTEKDVPAMLDLTQRTNPGPFLTRTIEFGNYGGIFKNDRLIAMAGQRLKPGLYTEISAVCTDPAYTGMGLAKRLVLYQVKSILAESRIPMLHLMPGNKTAYTLYKKLGFSLRKEMMVYSIRKQ